MIKLINKTIITGLLILFLLVVFFKISSAQEYNIILTWEADSFYPADYKGKPPATPNSKIYVSATPVINNKFVNSYDKEFIWRVNDRFFNRGMGLDEISFEINEVKGFIYSVDVLVKDKGEEYNNSINITIRNQELIIDNPRPSNLIKLGEEVVLEAIPYFFNVTSLDYLSFFWSIDNVFKKEQKTNSLILNIGGRESLRGSNMLITGQVANKNNPTESAKSNLRLNIR